MLEKMRGGDKSREVREQFERTKENLGHALLLKKYTSNVADATPEQIGLAARDTIPHVWPIFWAFRIMVGLAFVFLFIFSAAFYFLAVRNLATQRWLLRLIVLSIPLPWIAAELGWIVAEYGRQPWTIYRVMRTSEAVTNTAVAMWNAGSRQ